MSIRTVILAAGFGKRMHSQHPKVLHHLAGKPMLERVISIAHSVSEKTPIIIYGHQGDIIRNSLSHLNVTWVEQKEQLGTGHAVLQALPEITDEERILVLYGDVPLISEITLKKLIDATTQDAIGMITAHLPNPAGYGRIKRNNKNQIENIVEEKDASESERRITEINPGIYFVPGKYLKKWLPKLTNNNAQKEFYLTDIISKAAQEKIAIHDIQPHFFEEILGVNDRVQLAQLERFYQKNYAEKLMRQGVTIVDPARFDIRGEVQVGRDVTIDVNVILEGRVVIGDGCVIGPHSILRNTTLQNQVEIKAHSMIDGAEIGKACVIGPFARIRPGTVLAAKAHIGNFVEIKNSFIDEASKVNHLSYIGDSEIGKRVNIGAGTITCNYDGVNKHKTVIGDDVQIGSDTQLVAPVSVGEGATIGAGSTITKDVPPHQLTLSHQLVQRTAKNWQRPPKKS